MKALCIVLFCMKYVFGTHFNGGTITWQPLNSSDMASPVSIAITQTYSWVYPTVPCNQSVINAQTPIDTTYNNNDVLACSSACPASYGYTSPVPIARFCISFSTALGITNTQRVDIVQLSVNASFSIAFNPANLAYWRPLQLSSGATPSTASWSISTSINLNRRSDNGLLNTAPIGNVISPVEIPQNIPQNLVIPVIDANNDVLRCRWARKSPIDECMEVCPPASLPAGVVLSSNCTLSITGTINNAWYVATIMVSGLIDLFSLKSFVFLSARRLYQFFEFNSDELSSHSVFDSCCCSRPLFYSSRNQWNKCCPHDVSWSSDNSSIHFHIIRFEFLWFNSDDR